MRHKGNNRKRQTGGKHLREQHKETEKRTKNNNMLDQCKDMQGRYAYNKTAAIEGSLDE